MNIIIIYILLHFISYTLYLRNLEVFKTEKGIFLLHFISFLVFSCGAFIYFNSPLLMLGTMAVHGIYSLSFLELWSLSQGGYSLSILNLAPLKTDDRVSLQKLEDIGDQKLNARLAGLEKLGVIVRGNDSMLHLSRRGRYASYFLNLIMKLTNRTEKG